MGTSVKFTPLCGAFSDDPFCYLLQIDSFRILLDCGWTDAFDLELLNPLGEVAPTIDAVLLAHSDMRHLGALPYAVSKLGLNATVYCTIPVHKMGQILMYDHYLARRAVSDFDLFTLDDVDAAFENSIQLKYSQPQAMGEKGAGIIITPYAAGHLLGGTVWKITKDTEDIVYAVDYNHRMEKHLNGTVLESMIRPTVLITDAANAESREPRKKERDAEFFDTVVRTLRSGGSVLLPVEPSGRVLELLLYLEQYWDSHKFKFPIFFITHVSMSTIDSAKNMLEWMSDTIVKNFETNRENPFNLKHIKACYSKSEVDNYSSPKVILASMASLEVGPSRDIFIEMAHDEINAVIFTEKSYPASLATYLQQKSLPSAIELEISQKVPLEGDELREYEEAKLLQEEMAKQAEEKSKEEEEEEEKEKEKEKEVEDAYMEDVAQKNEPSAKGQEIDDDDDSHMEIQLENEDFQNEIDSTVLIEGFTSTTPFPMFPFFENSNTWDEYGESINPTDYKTQEEESTSFSLPKSNIEVPGMFTEGIDDIMEELPHKIIFSKIMIPIRCQIRSFDFEGISDGKSIKTILNHVYPLKLILIHGNEEITKRLKTHCQRNFCPFVQIPHISDWMDLTSDLTTFKVQLSEDFLHNISFKKLGEYEVAWVDGQISKFSESEKVFFQGENSFPLVPISPNQIPNHTSVLVGDLKLSDFKVLLKSHNMEAEFVGAGVLKCGNSVVIKKMRGQNLVMEGVVCEDYYKIRDLLYSQFYVL